MIDHSSLSSDPGDLQPFAETVLPCSGNFHPGCAPWQGANSVLHAPETATPYLPLSTGDYFCSTSERGGPPPENPMQTEYRLPPFVPPPRHGDHGPMRSSAPPSTSSYPIHASQDLVFTADGQDAASHDGSSAWPPVPTWGRGAAFLSSQGTPFPPRFMDHHNHHHHHHHHHQMMMMMNCNHQLTQHHGEPSHFHRTYQPPLHQPHAEELSRPFLPVQYFGEDVLQCTCMQYSGEYPGCHPNNNNGVNPDLLSFLGSFNDSTPSSPTCSQRHSFLHSSPASVASSTFQGSATTPTDAALDGPLDFPCLEMELEDSKSHENPTWESAEDELAE